MKTCLSAVLTILLATAAATADDAPLKGDLAKIQGVWTAKVGPDDSVAIRLTFKKNDVALAITGPDGKEFDTNGEITLNDQAKPHKTIDWRKFTNPDGDDLGENKSIYEFEDADTLKVCSGGGGNERPTEFKAGEGGSPHLIVLTREKDKGKDKDKDKDKDKEPAKEKAAAADVPAAVKGDLARFQGKWTTKVGPNKDFTLTLTIKGSSALVSGTTPGGEDFEIKGEVKLDDAAKPHKTLDWIKFVGPQGNEVPPNLAIYEFESDDAIKVCSGGPGNDRPTEFKAGEGGPPNLAVMKREKE